MEIPSERKKNSDSFIIHRRSAGRHLTGGDEKTVADICKYIMAGIYRNQKQWTRKDGI